MMMLMMAVDKFVLRNMRHVIVISGLVACFTLHNYMQELIMSQPNFKHGAILAFLDVLGVTVFSGAERVLSSGEKARVAPWSSYVVLCLFLCMR